MKDWIGYRMNLAINKLIITYMEKILIQWCNLSTFFLVASLFFSSIFLLSFMFQHVVKEYVAICVLLHYSPLRHTFSSPALSKAPDLNEYLFLHLYTCVYVMFIMDLFVSVRRNRSKIVEKISKKFKKKSTKFGNMLFNRSNVAIQKK